jgi:hypothetical protein
MFIITSKFELLDILKSEAQAPIAGASFTALILHWVPHCGQGAGSILLIFMLASAIL